MTARSARRLTVALLTAMALALPASSWAAEAPDATIQRTVDAALTVLRDKSLAGGDKRSERLAALRKVADKVFDWEDMAKRSLGVHWRSIDDAQRKRFIAVFTDLLAEHYMGDLDRFRGSETVTVDGAVADGDDQVVKTTLKTASHETVPIDYYMHQEGDQWWIHDATIEGVSLTNHYRKSFSRVLVNGTFDDLLAKLERKQKAVQGSGGSTASD
jgi:phospholipid transport system substrate-binding protein